MGAHFRKHLHSVWQWQPNRGLSLPDIMGAAIAAHELQVQRLQCTAKQRQYELQFEEAFASPLWLMQENNCCRSDVKHISSNVSSATVTLRAARISCQPLSPDFAGNMHYLHDPATYNGRNRWSCSTAPVNMP